MVITVSQKEVSMVKHDLDLLIVILLLSLVVLFSAFWAYRCILHRKKIHELRDNWNGSDISTR